MVEYIAIPSIQEHIDSLAPRMAAMDIQEIWDSYHQTPREALEIGLRDSDHILTGVADETPHLMMGVVRSSALSATGLVWFLGSEELPKYSIGFLRRCKPVIEQLKLEYTGLYNFVDARNQRCIRWLKWMGFEIAEAKPFGIEQQPFHFAQLGEL
jgi:hypothetical protein